MSIAIGRAADPIPVEGGAVSPLQSLPVMVAIGFALTLAMSWGNAAEVWRTGIFANTDDAMRLVEVRDWLTGQAWFDLHQYRLDPPEGAQMHWTRVIDVPLGLLIRLFSIVLPGEAAERLTRIVFPLALHAGVFAVAAGLARKLAGPAAMLPATVIMVLSGAVLVKFQPGRIHHHAPQILLAVSILWATVAAIDTRKLRTAAAAAALSAVSLSINLENLPLVLVEVAAFAVVFVAQGERFRDTLMVFALSLAVCSLIVFVVTVGPSRYLIGACDAFSTAHLGAIVLGAAALALLARLSKYLTSPMARLAGCALGAAMVVGATAVTYPACLHNPLSAVDPLLRRLWLDNIEEDAPLLHLVAAYPANFGIFALAPLFGFAAALAAAWSNTGDARLKWLIACAFMAIALATAMWQVRALAEASALAVFGGAWIVVRATDWAARRSGAVAILAPFALCLPFCSLFWVIIAPARAQSEEAKGRAECLAPAAIDQLRALPPSLLLAPIDMGSEILAGTRHSVLAAPYHRNNHGNRQLVDAMIAEPDAAPKIVADSGAFYLVFCPGMPELKIYAADSPKGLAAALLAGNTPAWLAPAPITGSPYRIFKLR